MLVAELPIVDWGNFEKRAGRRGNGNTFSKDGVHTLQPKRMKERPKKKNRKSFPERKKICNSSSNVEKVVDERATAISILEKVENQRHEKLEHETKVNLVLVVFQRAF